jgi:hypothetical protein
MQYFTMIAYKAGSSRYHHKTQPIGVQLAFGQLFRQLFRLLADAGAGDI